MLLQSYLQTCHYFTLYLNIDLTFLCVFGVSGRLLVSQGLMHSQKTTCMMPRPPPPGNLSSCKCVLFG